MSEEQRDERLDERRFEAWLEAFEEGATGHEVDAHEKPVTHDG